MIKNKELTLAVGLAVVLPISAGASDLFPAGDSHFSYNYAEAFYVDVDGYDSGFMFRGSYDFKENIAFVGSYLTSGDYAALSFGAAYHSEATFMANADLVLHASYESAEIDFSETNCGFFGCFTTSYSDDDTGLTFGATLRHELQEGLEVFGDVSYSTIWDGNIILTGGAAYAVKPGLSVMGSYQIYDDLDTLSLGIRYLYK